MFEIFISMVFGFAFAIFIGHLQTIANYFFWPPDWEAIMNELGMSWIAILLAVIAMGIISWLLKRCSKKSVNETNKRLTDIEKMLKQLIQPDETNKGE